MTKSPPRLHKEILLVVLIVGFTLGTVSGRANAAANVVYPSGSFPDDVRNVQGAVDRGGTVLLKATNAAGTPTPFNFGTPEPFEDRHVSLNTDVELIGEQVGSYMTTIRGGYIPLQGHVPIKSRIQGIDFESPLGLAISIRATTGVEIVANRINRVVPHLLPVGFTAAQGISVSGSNDPTAIQGSVRVANNFIDNLIADMAAGIQLDEISHESEITGNTVGTAQSFGIGVFRSGSSVLIERNALVSSAVAAIFIGGRDNAAFEVSHNVIQIPKGFFNTGILLSGGNFGEGATVGAVIEQNLITGFDPTALGVGTAGLVSDSEIQANRIDGQGFFALLASTGFDPGDLDVGTSNHFQGNDVSNFTATVADVLFDTNTRDTTLVGHCKSIIDLGVNNSATCEIPLSAGPPVQVLRSALMSNLEQIQLFMRNR